MSNAYKTPQAFRMALEAKQKQRAKAANVPVERVAQVDLFFRFLARVTCDLGESAVIVKGGVALELRLQRARSTRDIDLRVSGNPAQVYERIRKAGQLDLGDFLTFNVEEPNGPRPIEGDGIIYEGRRFSVQAFLANKPFLSRFGLDVAFGDALVGAPDRVRAPDGFAFAGIEPSEIAIYPLGTHLAEKLHAYTRPLQELRPNSRMKDLLDIALIAAEPALAPSRTIEASTVRRSLEETFRSRKTHPLPALLPPFPEQWRTRYPREKEMNRLPWSDLDEVHAEAATFFHPILDGRGRGEWSPLHRSWIPS